MSQPLMIVNFGTINMNGDIHINCEESGNSALKKIRAAAACAVAASDDLEKTPWVAASLKAEMEERAAVERRERLRRAMFKMPPTLSQIVDCIKKLHQESGKKRQKLPAIYKMVKSKYPEWWYSIDKPDESVRDTLQQGTVELGWIDGKSYTGKGVGQTVFEDLKTNRNKKCIWRVSRGCYAVMTAEEQASLRINYRSDTQNYYITITLGNDSSSYKKTKSIVSKI